VPAPGHVLVLPTVRRKKGKAPPLGYTAVLGKGPQSPKVGPFSLVGQLVRQLERQPCQLMLATVGQQPLASSNFTRGCCNSSSFVMVRPFTVRGGTMPPLPVKVRTVRPRVKVAEAWVGRWLH
jgi:hypothetical protein